MKGKVLITGATSGLGLAYARAYAGKGYDLIVTGRRKEKLEKNMQEIEKTYKVHVKRLILELANEEGLQKLLEEIQSEEIQVLINNAGFGLKPGFAEVSREDMDRILFLHNKVTTTLTHWVLKQMIERNSGTIINVASDGAFLIMPHNVLYGATKRYLVALTEGIYTELHQSKIKVQVVCPGFMDTDFHESAKMKVNKKQKGFMKFSRPEDIVKKSMKDLEKGKVVCRPTLDVKLIDWMSRFMPRAVAYNIAISLTAKMLSRRKHAWQ